MKRRTFIAVILSVISFHVITQKNEIILNGLYKVNNTYILFKKDSSFIYCLVNPNNESISILHGEFSIVKENKDQYLNFKSAYQVDLRLRPTNIQYTATTKGSIDSIYFIGKVNTNADKIFASVFFPEIQKGTSTKSDGTFEFSIPASWMPTQISFNNIQCIPETITLLPYHNYHTIILDMISEVATNKNLNITSLEFFRQVYKFNKKISNGYLFDKKFALEKLPENRSNLLTLINNYLEQKNANTYNNLLWLKRQLE